MPLLDDMAEPDVSCSTVPRDLSCICVPAAVLQSSPNTSCKADAHQLVYIQVSKQGHAPVCELFQSFVGMQQQADLPPVLCRPHVTPPLVEAAEEAPLAHVSSLYTGDTQQQTARRGRQWQAGLSKQTTACSAWTAHADAAKAGMQERHKADVCTAIAPW
jgi:hypothetical protein